MKYVLVDTANTFFRARHVVRGELDVKVGMAFHITFNSLKKAWNDFDADHIVFCLEGRSWRKDFYQPYKRNRQEFRDALTEAQQEEEKVFWETFDSFRDFITQKTNCTVLQHDELEADDLIAGWIQHHPNDEHVIISTDGDFAQLISPKVSQYNGVSNVTITSEGYFDDKGKRVVDKKTGKEKAAPNPEWLLFEKCMRGDGKEHRVLDDYNRNVMLCDLTAQPENIKEKIETTIKENAQPKNIKQVGLRLMKFCALYDMQRITDNAQAYAEPLQARYPV